MYRFLRAILRLLFSVLFRWEISGTKNIPLKGGVIVAANHISLWDPPVLGSALPREVHFMAKQSLFTIPVLGYIITKLNAFPITRGAADRLAIRTTMDILSKGQLVGMFPEGTRSKTGELGKAKQGVATIALHTGSTIVPAAIIGTNKIFKKDNFLPKIKVKFGNPIIIDKAKRDKDYIEKISNEMMQEIALLLKEE